MKLKNSKGKLIDYDFNIFDLDKRNPTLIFVHGFLSFGDEEYFKYLKDKFSKKYNVLSFDFTNEVGKSEGELDETNYFQRLDDLRCVVDFLKNHQNVDSKKIGLIGHSLGGVVCANCRKVDEEILFSVSLSSPFKVSSKSFLEFGCLEEDLKNWEDLGFLDINNPYHKKQLRVPFSFYKEMLGLDISEFFKGLKNHLVVQGRLDKIVDLENANKIYNVLDEPKDIFFVDNLKHYYKGEDNLLKVFNKINLWCDKFF